MTWTPSTSTSWWSSTSLARSTSPGRRTTSRRSRRDERNDTSAWPIRSMAEAGTKASAAPDLDHEPADGRVDLPVRPAGHDVVEAADLLARLVAHRTARASPASDTMESKTPSGRQDAARAAASLVRAGVRDCGSARAAAGAGSARSPAVAWSWSYLLLRSSGGSVGSDGRTRGTRPAVQRPAPVSLRYPP